MERKKYVVQVQRFSSSFFFAIFITISHVEKLSDDNTILKVENARNKLCLNLYIVVSNNICFMSGTNVEVVVDST